MAENTNNLQYEDSKFHIENAVLNRVEGTIPDGGTTPAVMLDADFKVNGKFDNGGVIQETIDNSEFVQVTTDSEGRIIEATKNNGKKVFPGGIEGVSEVIEELQTALIGTNLHFIKNGNNISFVAGENELNGVLDKSAYLGEYNANPVFSFTTFKYNGNTVEISDCIAPQHVLNSTFGANHAQPCIDAKISSHNLDNTAIGTEWLDGSNTKYYVMRIVDANHVIFLSENKGTIESPNFIPLETGTLTKGNTTLVVESVSNSQLYPCIKNESITILDNNGIEIIDDGEYNGDFFDIVETYDIVHPQYALESIIARAGESTKPSYNGNAFVTIKNQYRVTKELTVITTKTIVPLSTFAFEDAQIFMAQTIGANGTVRYYIPHSLPVGVGGVYDMRQPLLMTWGNDVPFIYVTENQMANPSIPVNRIIQITTGVGCAIGYVTDRGTGKNILANSKAPFEIRNNSGKVYPYAINNTALSNNLQVGDIYTGTVYWSLFTPPSSGDRISMYHFNLDGEEYVYVDYSGSMIDLVYIGDDFNSKKIEVIESSNTELVSDTYNRGFYVKTTYVANETCYLIVKIK